MAPRRCHFFADIFTLGILFSFVVIGLYVSVKNANENYGTGVYIPFILPRDESHYNDVRDFLIQNNVSSQEALDKFNSPQQNALLWIAETDDRGLQIDDPKLIQRYVLVLLYYSTDGANWVNRDKYLTDALECQWHGIDCTNETMVVNISLASNNLVGELPSEISSLSSLQNLHLYENTLTGNLLNENVCTDLEILDLSKNELTGTIAFMSKACEKLTSLKLANNRFSGSLPLALKSLTKLQILDLNSNKLTGTVPPISRLTSLTDLLLGDNKFNSSLPSDLLWLGLLKNVDLFDNEFTGKIPAKWQGVKNVERLQLAGNQITGVVSYLGKLTKLRALTLQYNNFTGDLPQDICNITTLSRLMADCNCEGGNSLDSCTCCTSCCCRVEGSYTCNDV